MELKRTPLYQQHIKNNARIIDFFGWAMPLEYTSILKEAKAVRAACGMFDASHMGQILVKGSLQGLASNDLSRLKNGQVQYNLLLNQDQGIIDDCLIYRLEEGFLLVVNASNKLKVLERLKKNSTRDFNGRGLICLQGPRAQEIAAKIFSAEVTSLAYMSFYKTKDFLISRTGYTGEDGFEICLSADQAENYWEKLKESGAALCGLGSRDILRIEAGYPLYGHEINEDTLPSEAGLDWAVKPHRDTIIKKKRVGFIMEEKAFPRQGHKAIDNQKEIGYVTSGAYSPNLNKFIGMAYVDKDYAFVGKEINIEVRGRLVKAKIAEFPFISIRTINKKPREVL